jgi:hypothetical protein
LPCVPRRLGVRRKDVDGRAGENLEPRAAREVLFKARDSAASSFQPAVGPDRRAASSVLQLVRFGNSSGGKLSSAEAGGPSPEPDPVLGTHLARPEIWGHRSMTSFRNSNTILSLMLFIELTGFGDIFEVEDGRV